MYKDANQIIRVNNVKTEILDILKHALKLEEYNKFVCNLEKEGFFVKPASIKYHNNFTGGLALHCFTVYYNLLELCKRFEAKNDRFDKMGYTKNVALIAFGHDLCKLDDYVFNEETNSWVYHEEFKPGHSQRSLQKLKDWGVEIDEEVEACIRFHMGAFEKKEYTWNELSDANDKYPLSLLTHIADNLDAHNITYKD